MDYRSLQAPDMETNSNSAVLHGFSPPIVTGAVRSWSDGGNRSATAEMSQQATMSESESSQNGSDLGSRADLGEDMANHPLDSRLTWSKFTRSLFEMANAEENAAAIGFSPDGNFLEIRDAKFLGEQVLPKYYKHRNVSSFVRQLNNYGFKTIPGPGASNNIQSYHHEHFRRGRLDLLGLVVRKSTIRDDKKKKAKKYASSAASADAAAFREREREYLLRMDQVEEQNRRLILENAVLMEENKRLRMSLGGRNQELDRHYGTSYSDLPFTGSSPMHNNGSLPQQGFMAIPDPPMSLPPYPRKGSHAPSQASATPARQPISQSARFPQQQQQQQQQADFNPGLMWNSHSSVFVPVQHSSSAPHHTQAPEQERR